MNQIEKAKKNNNKEERNKMNAYLKLLFKHKREVLILFTGITVFFAYQLKNISVESRTQMWFKKDDSYYIKYKKFKEEFGNDHILIIGIRPQRLFSQETQIYIKQISEKIRAIEGVHSVTSIIDVERFSSFLRLHKNTFNDFFLSKDKEATQIVVNVTEEGSQFLRRKIIRKVRKIIEESNIPEKEVYFSGSLFMGAELDRYAKENTWKIILFTLAGISLILLLILKKFSLTFIVLLTSIIAVIWSMGFYVVMGNAINLVTNMIIPLVLIISIAFGIHIINRVQEELPRADTKKETIISGVSHIWVPCFLTSLTTSIGFFSLYFSPSNAISKFGLYTASAMLFEFIVFFHIFPLFLHFTYKFKSQKRIKNKSLLEGFLSWNSRVITSRKRVIIFIFLISTIILSGGFSRISVNTNQLKYFSSKSELVKSAKFFDKHFGGIYPIQAVLTSDQENIFQKPKILNKILDFQKQTIEEDNLRKEISVADIALSTNSVLHGENPTKQEKSSINFLSLLLRNDDRGFLNRLVDNEFRKTVVTFRASSEISSKEMMKIQSRLQALARKVFDKENLSVELTGIIPLYAHFYEYIVNTQIISFLIAFSLIIVIIGLTFRSFSLTLVVALSNLISIIMIFGLMGYIGINLDAGTVMIASIAIGIIVDDTIHTLFRIGWELKNTKQDYKKALRGTIKTLGRALIITSTVNGLGFLILIFSDFKPAKFFGILMALTMLSALVADMILLPFLIYKFKIKIRKINI
ncbi:MAG: MMPL family transporter [Candidatus Aminicenantes bacterium]|nr:MMPL family transporter [Candidatus Aminicenantes bacterium]